jgi:hypothetical protein
MAGPYVGVGNALEFASVASPATYTTLVGVDSIAISSDKVTISKTTTMASPNGVDTKIASTQDPGMCDVKGFWMPGDATQTALEAIRLAGSVVNFKITYGSSNSCSFAGIVESFTPAFPLEKPATFDLKIAITGPKTYA